MVKPRRKYDKGFKNMVVELLESRKTVAEVSEKLAVHKTFFINGGVGCL